MALVVENGDRIPGANSYISAEDATAYLTAYNPAALDVWPTDQASQEQALIVGCQTLELLYGSRYLSTRIYGVQSLLFPRYAFYDKNLTPVLSGIPVQLGQAQTEFAVLFLSGTDLFPNTVDQGNVIEEFTRIDSIQTRTRYKDTRSYILFPKIDQILYPIIKSKNVSKMSR